ncbi:MAG: hypothetical protein JXQ87_09105 [Bacteroidia bacterium]
MKKALSIIFGLFLSHSLWAQQGYLLLPADTPGVVKINESEQLRRITSQKVKVNRIKKFDGYRIEIYQGNDRIAAQETLEKFKEEYPYIPAKMVFEKPYVKIKVGIFRSKLEAQPLFFDLKREYEASKVVFVKGVQFPPLNNKKVEKEKSDKIIRVEDF